MDLSSGRVGVSCYSPPKKHSVLQAVSTRDKLGSIRLCIDIFCFVLKPQVFIRRQDRVHPEFSPISPFCPYSHSKHSNRLVQLLTLPTAHASAPFRAVPTLPPPAPPPKRFFCIGIDLDAPARYQKQKARTRGIQTRDIWRKFFKSRALLQRERQRKGAQQIQSSWRCASESCATVRSDGTSPARTGPPPLSLLPRRSCCD